MKLITIVTINKMTKEVIFALLNIFNDKSQIIISSKRNFVDNFSLKF